MTHLDGFMTFGTSISTGVRSLLANNWSKIEGEGPGICPIKVSVNALLAGVVAGRCGLWLTDIVITQIQQQEIAEEIRGKIGGVQGALNSTFDLVRYGLVLSFPQVSQFGDLIFASYISVLCGALLYTTYARCGYRNSSRSADNQAETSKTEGRYSITPLLPSPFSTPSSVTGDRSVLYLI